MSDEVIDVEGGANVLILGESGTRTERCCDVLLDIGPADQRAELSVTFPEDITDRTRFDTGFTGRQPNKHGQITVGDILRSVETTAPEFDEPVATDIVEDPGNLTAIGSAVSRFCEVWADDGHRIVLCFDSISGLLDHSDAEVVFQFLHTLLGRLSGVGTVAHFHLEASQYDQQLVTTFGTLFDDVVDPADENELLADAPVEEDSEASEPTLSDGIPATSGSSQATDSDIVAQLDEQDESYEVADGRSNQPPGRKQATDDEIAAQIEKLDEEMTDAE